ncbi:MAG TPA: cytochrome o ubiquinol/quinol oxidase subunit IV [Candidatus Saccharimonadia bacterium]|jgi:cytochrome o ubiquinol oxidase operon protein cyoD
MKKEHGTIQNYVIGFILSLVFTLIPYYLAVTHTVTGNVLLGTILTFALLQAAVQVFFFLHLGREQSPHWQSKFLAITVGGIFVVTVGTTWIMYHLHENMTPTETELKLAQDEGIGQVGGKATGACVGNSEMHMVVIKNGAVSPYHTDAHRCDTIMFMNEDNVPREIAFGPHENHEPYGGVAALALNSVQEQQTLTLNESGTYMFHDHLHAEVIGDFTVTP